MTKEEAISIISGYEAYGCGYCLQGDEEVEEALRLAVDALRQETVIRCKDCKHWNEHYRECNSPNWDTGTDDCFVVPAGFYCGWAERRGE